MRDVYHPSSRSLLLDNERWKQAEVPAEFQDLVNAIADGRMTLPDRKIPGERQACCQSAPQTGNARFRVNSAVSAGSEERKPADYLLVDGQKYAVIGYVSHEPPPPQWCGITC